MAKAYTPGLKVSSGLVHRARRALPTHGEVRVAVGDRVQGSTVVAETFLEGDVTPMKVANLLGCQPRDLPTLMLKKVGESVASGEVIARSKGAAPGTFIGGRIVNIASMAGLRVLGQIGVYCMSKAAVIHMTRAMALEWGRYGINVNAICPGYIDTEINHHHWKTEQGQKLVNMLPRKRVGQPQDLDSTLLMLCAPQSHFINGAVISADDGFGV